MASQVRLSLRSAIFRRRYLLPLALTVVIVLIGGFEFDHLANHPRIDLTLSGALGGKIVKLEDWQGHSTTCSTSRVYGKEEWTGQFVGLLNGSHVLLNVALYPFHGAGRYINDGVPDAQTLASKPFIQAFGSLDVHILLSSMPEGAADARRYGTEPDPSSRPQSLADLAEFAGLGKASVRLDPNRMSGAIDALLMNARTPTASPTHVLGTFQCVGLGKGSDV